ncbi:MAG: HEAT repeat domain-containing protein [Candidatus Kariarchaeaceae archaeon]|jgi:HEAT repeat protein
MGFTTPELIQMLKSENPEERGAAARRIWTDWEILENREMINDLDRDLVQLLRDEKRERNIWHIMIVLGLINSAEALPLISDYLKNSEDENIRGFAADSLSRYQPNALEPQLLKLLWSLSENDPSLVVRVNSIRAYTNQFRGTKNDEISVKLFDLLKKQSHSAVKTSILQQIGEIGSLVIVPDLIHIMITRRTEIDKKMAGIALDMIAKSNGYENREILINQFSANDI